MQKKKLSVSGFDVFATTFNSISSTFFFDVINVSLVRSLFVRIEMYTCRYMIFLCSFFADDNEMTNDKFTLAIHTPHTPYEKKRCVYAQITAPSQTSLLLHIG